MPNRKTTKVTVTAFTNMEARVEALETSIADVQRTMAENHASLLAMMEKCLGKSVNAGESSAGVVSDATPTSQISSEKAKETVATNLRDDALTEFRQSVKRVELPAFDGDDPAGWISRAEVYFRVQNTLPAVKVSLAQLCMEGSTIHFFNSLLREDEDLSWEGLKEALLERYGGHGEGDVYEQLSELKQEGTIEEYITDFEYLVAQIPKLPEKQFQGYFLHGLKKEIKGRVRSLVAMGEMSRSKLMQVTRAVEKEFMGQSGSGSNQRNGSRYNGSQRIGPNKDRSDWVMVKKEVGNTGGAKSGSSGA
ncbi:hypothetical protein A2U01_0021523, partial [Trifolium medium]|nr:hypothetical protein [Trifolium medium]